MQARQHVLDDLNKTGKAQRVKGFERIAAVYLDPEEWTVDNDMVRDCHLQILSQRMVMRC